jgi:hypothetical protein
MIPVLDLLFSFDTKANRLSNLRGQFIPNETKVDLLNKAQTKLILRKVDVNNVYQLGLDSFAKRYEDLQNLQIKYEKLSLTAAPGDLLHSYTVPFSAMKYDMVIPITAYVLASKGNCKDRILDVIDIMKHADIRMLLKSPHYQPSFKYQETLGEISEDTISIYSDPENSFTVTDLYISYLRYPKDIDVAGYIHLNGTPSVNQDCELESYLEDELLDIAIAEYADATSNQELSQYSRVRAKENE